MLTHRDHEALRPVYRLGWVALAFAAYCFGTNQGTRDAQVLGAEQVRLAKQSCDGAAYRSLNSGEIVCFHGSMRNAR
jgi:hypothetical protein